MIKNRNGHCGFPPCEATFSEKLALTSAALNNQAADHKGIRDSRWSEMDDLRDKFVERGLRCTRQRRAVYGALCSTTQHPTADELHHMVRSHDAGVSLATVYNALEVFASSGLCRKLPTTSGSVRYDADMNDHLHFRSETDGQIRDICPKLSGRLLNNLPADILREIECELGVSIDRVQIQLIGHSGEPSATE